MNDKENAALERLRNPDRTESLSFEESLGRSFSAVADLTVVAGIALRDHPADDVDGMKKLRSVFDAGFNACRRYGVHQHYRGEQADRVFSEAMKNLGIEP